MLRFVILFLALLFSCSQKTWVLEGSGEASNGLKVSIKTEEWKYSPYQLKYYAMPVYIEVENLSDKPVEIRREDVFLIDEKNNQYNPLSPSDVLSMFRRGYGFGISFGFGYSTYPWSTWFSPSYAHTPYPDVYEDIVNLSFTFGRLQPGARLKGFVYFPLIKEKVSSATLYVVDYRFSLKLKE